MNKTKNRYHLSAYLSDFVVADSEDDAWDEFHDIVINAKLSDFILEIQDIEELDGAQ